MIDALKDQVIFLGDFNPKHKQFGCVKQNRSGQTLGNKHMHEDPFHGTSDILDMDFISPCFSSRDLSFSSADDHMSSDHFPIQISLDKPLKRNTPLTELHYRFDKTNDNLLHSTLKDSLTNMDTNITAQDNWSNLQSPYVTNS